MLLFKEKVEKIPVLIVVWIYERIILWMYIKKRYSLKCSSVNVHMYNLEFFDMFLFLFSPRIPEFSLVLLLYFTHLLLIFLFFPPFKIVGSYYKVELLKNEVNSGRTLFCCTNVCHSIKLLAWMTVCNWAFWICRNNWFICSLWRYNLVIRREKKVLWMIIEH